jgi:hypothetical protein
MCNSKTAEVVEIQNKNEIKFDHIKNVNEHLSFIKFMLYCLVALIIVIVGAYICAKVYNIIKNRIFAAIRREVSLVPFRRSVRRSEPATPACNQPN